MTSPIRDLQAKLTAARTLAENVARAADLADATRSLHAQGLYMRSAEIRHTVATLETELAVLTACMSYVKRLLACYSDEDLIGMGFDVAAMRASLRQTGAAA